jgi:hypothetical protein
MLTGWCYCCPYVRKASKILIWKFLGLSRRRGSETRGSGSTFQIDDGTRFDYLIGYSLTTASTRGLLFDLETPNIVDKKCGKTS